MTDNKQGVFVVSLDFEMMWGCHDKESSEKYGDTNIRHVRMVINRLLELFLKYDVHVTFATVGLIFCSDKTEAQSQIPSQLPSYYNSQRSPFRNGYMESISPNNECLYFAPDVITQLKEYTNIEIGTHTYSHYYCWEKGQTTAQFEADIEMACKVAKARNITLQSIVFPRNQVAKEYLTICAKHGIKTYRGNPGQYFDETTNRFKILNQKIARLLDTYVNWGGNTTYPYTEIDRNESPINIPASRMLRPYMRKLRIFEGMRLRRIKKEMRYAAKHHEIYHLWWHPHNFGANMEENLFFLENVLECFEECRQKEGMISMTMNELYEFVNE